MGGKETLELHVLSVRNERTLRRTDGARETLEQPVVLDVAGAGHVELRGVGQREHLEAVGQLVGLNIVRKPGVQVQVVRLGLIRLVELLLRAALAIDLIGLCRRRRLPRGDRRRPVAESASALSPENADGAGHEQTVRAAVIAIQVQFALVHYVLSPHRAKTAESRVHVGHCPALRVAHRRRAEAVG